MRKREEREREGGLLQWEKKQTIKTDTDIHVAMLKHCIRMKAHSFQYSVGINYWGIH